MRNQSSLGVLGATAAGAGLMFLLDPDRGSRRRAILRDKLISLSRGVVWAADKTSRDLTNRVYGIVASVRSRFSDTAVDDDVLVERIRSQLGRAVSHPHAIHVTAKDGQVTLSGEILVEEVSDLLRSISMVKGVQRIENQLRRHLEPGDIASLQGGRTRYGTSFALLQSHWPPAVRLLVGASGALAAGVGAKQGGFLGTILGALGAGVGILAITNQSVREISHGVTGLVEEQVSGAKAVANTLRFPAKKQQTG